MNFEQIEKLITLLDETSIHEFKYETETLNLRICKEKTRRALSTPRGGTVTGCPSAPERW